MANEIDTTLLDNLNSIKNSKADIKQALINKGQSPTNILADYAQLIENIQTGEDLNDVLNIQDQKIAELEEALENKTAGSGEINYEEVFRLAVSIYDSGIEDDSETADFTTDDEQICLQRALKILKGGI